MITTCQKWIEKRIFLKNELKNQFSSNLKWKVNFPQIWDEVFRLLSKNGFKSEFFLKMKSLFFPELDEVWTFIKNKLCNEFSSKMKWKTNFLKNELKSDCPHISDEKQIFLKTDLKSEFSWKLKSAFFLKLILKKRILSKYELENTFVKN